MAREHQRQVEAAERLVNEVMGKQDASHDASHAFRVRSLALSLASEECLHGPSLQIVELAALLHDIGDHKYARDEYESKAVERFLENHDVEPFKRGKILNIISKLGFKDELSGDLNDELMPEFGVVQDADRLDAIGAIGIARCFAYGGSRNHMLHDPAVQVRTNLMKEEYVKQDGRVTIVNHFFEKLLKLKDLMKTQAGKRRAERRHQFMECFLTEFYKEWDGKI